MDYAFFNKTYYDSITLVFEEMDLIVVVNLNRSVGSVIRNKMKNISTKSISDVKINCIPSFFVSVEVRILSIHKHTKIGNLGDFVQFLKSLSSPISTLINLNSFSALTARSDKAFHFGANSLQKVHHYTL